MITGTKMPIWKRAAIRGLIAGGVLFAALEAAILIGKTTKIGTGEALVLSFISGAGYAALWSAFAAFVARMMAKVEARAREEQK